MHDIDKSKFGIYEKNTQSKATFLAKMDKLFDCLNSKQLFCSLKPFRSGLRRDDKICQYLLEMREYFREIERPKRNVCLDGTIQTINAVLLLAKDIFDSDLEIDILLTSKLNQDPIENLFSSVRARGGFNKNPSLKEFIFLMARIMSMKYLSGPQLTSNCEADDDDFIESATLDLDKNNSNEDDNTDESIESVGFDLILSNFLNTNADPKHTTEESSIIGLPSIPDESIQTASIRYFAGYAVFKLFKSVNCEKCNDTLMKKDGSIRDKSELLILNKNYNLSSDFGQLVQPLDDFFNICKLHIEIFTFHFKKNPEMTKIAETIENFCIDATTSNQEHRLWFAESPCLSHRKRILRFMLQVLLFKNCKWLNNKTDSTTKSSKLKIFNHNNQKTLQAKDMMN